MGTSSDGQCLIGLVQQKNHDTMNDHCALRYKVICYFLRPNCIGEEANMAGNALLANSGKQSLRVQIIFDFRKLRIIIFLHCVCH